MWMNKIFYFLRHSSRSCMYVFRCVCVRTYLRFRIDIEETCGRMRPYMHAFQWDCLIESLKMALSAMNKTSRARREILKIEKSPRGETIDSIDVVMQGDTPRFSHTYSPTFVYVHIRTHIYIYIQPYVPPNSPLSTYFFIYIHTNTHTQRILILLNVSP